MYVYPFGQARRITSDASSSAMTAMYGVQVLIVAPRLAA